MQNVGDYGSTTPDRSKASKFHVGLSEYLGAQTARSEEYQVQPDTTDFHAELRRDLHQTKLVTKRKPNLNDPKLAYLKELLDTTSRNIAEI